MSTRTSALDTLVFGVDVQSGDIRGDAPSYALVVLGEESLERRTVSRRKLLRLIDDERPDVVATDNMYELAADKDALVGLLRALPGETSLVQVTGDERPEPLSRVADRHGVPYGKNPMQEAEAAARLAARNVGYEVAAFTGTTTVKVSRGRSVGKGGWSEDRFTRRIHGAVRRQARAVESALDEAGLDYEDEITEKYGGFANAVFRVEATPGELPISTHRSGDVRVEIERERRDGIAFEPLAKRRDHVIVGIDPGTTTGVAIIGLEGEPLDVMSTRTADTAGVIEWIIERGRPVVVAADVVPMPGTVEKIRRSFDAAGWQPDRDLLVDEKLHRTREHAHANDHERDALAAALFAFDDHADRFDRIRSQVPPGTDVPAVIDRVVAGDESVEAALRALDPDEDDESAAPPEPPPREPTPAERRVSALEDRVERLQSHIEDLESDLAAKEDRIAEYEEALSEARREERREARERRTVNRLERETDRLRRDLEREREATADLEAKLDRLKALWKLDHSNFADVADGREGLLSLKPVDQFTIDAIEAAEAEYGLSRGDVILLRDASGAGRRTAERLAASEPRAVLKRGGLSEVADRVLFDHEIPVGPADEVAIQEVDELAVARERDVEAVIAAWRERADERARAKREQLVDRLISEHRADRKGVGPSELLDPE